MDLVNADPDKAQEIIQVLQSKGLSQTDITLVSLFQHARELRKWQQVYYKAKGSERDTALNEAKYYSFRLDQVLNLIEPTINKMLY